MVKQNLLFQALSLLSQALTEIKDARGELYQKTACINYEERETIGVLWATADLLDADLEASNEQDVKELVGMIRKQIIPFIEAIGISKWNRTELTDLGLRVGQKHRVRIDLSSDISTEVDITQDEASGDDA